MLVEALFNVVGLAAVKASGGLALKDVDPIRHNKIRPAKPAMIFVAPRVGLESRLRRDRPTITPRRD